MSALPIEAAPQTLQRRNRLDSSIEPFGEVMRCVVCALPVEVEGDVSYDGSYYLTHLIEGKSVKCEGCGNFVHQDCARHGECLDCTACAQCSEDAGEQPIEVCKGTIYPFLQRTTPGERIEFLCKRCYVERVGNILAGDSFSDECERHAVIVSAHETLAIAIETLRPLLTRTERDGLGRILHGEAA